MTQRMTSMPDADLEALSAYIDNELPAAERAALEARLRQEPQLRAALGELRGTVAALRDLPPVRPPRSFTLDSASVAPRRAWFDPARWMQFGAALAAVLLAFTFGVESFGGAASNAPQRTYEASGAAPASSGAAAPAPAPTVAATSKLVLPAVPAAPAPASAATAAPAADAPAAAASAAAPAAPMAQQAAGATTTQNESAEQSAADRAAPAAEVTIAAPRSSSPGTAELAPPAQQQLERREPGWSGVQIAQVLLAVLALALLGGSFLLRPRR